MRKKLIYAFVLLCCIGNPIIGFTQNVGINSTGVSPDSSAMLDISSADKGLLIPRMTTAQRDAITTPATGLMIYNNTDNQFNYYDGTSWTQMAGMAGSSVEIIDADGDTKVSVEQNPDEDKIRFYARNSLLWTMDSLRFFTNRGNIVLMDTTTVAADFLIDEETIGNVLIGNGAGKNTSYGMDNVAIGTNAGAAMTFANTNVLIGKNAAESSTNSSTSIAIGVNALRYGDGFANAIAIGSNSLNNNSAHDNIGIGNRAGYYLTSGGQNIYMSYTAGQNVTTGVRNVGIGYEAGKVRADFGNSSNSVAIGYRSGGGFNGSLDGSVMIGSEAGLLANDQNTMIGYWAGRTNTDGSGNVFMGYRAGENATGSNQLYIDNSNTTAPLIYGNFSTNHLIFNGSASVTDALSIGNAYTFPTTDGAANEVLVSNGAGILAWGTLPENNTLSSVPDSLSIAGGNQVEVVTSKMLDADGNTKIQVEETTNDNNIRFDINGTEKWVMQGSTLMNRDTNLLIGNYAGLNVTTGERLIALGNNALAANTTGIDNQAIGVNALASNTTGTQNIAIGNGALDALTTGDENVAIGQDALGVSTSSLNTAVGVSAGQGVTSGNGNTFLGHWAGFTVNLGSQNVMIGQYAGLNRNMSEATLVGHGAGSSSFGTKATAIGKSAGANSGHGGIYLGYGAGQNEYGADKLYIDNTNTSTPLIWGDLANDSIKIHGTFNINDVYSFPLSDGANGQVLQTDGAGQLSWGGGGQTLSINASDSLFISGGNGVNLSPYLDNTDAQDLSLSGDTLSLTNDGTSVDLSSFAGGNDDLGNHTASQDIIIGANAIQNNASSANGLTIGAENQLLVESESTRSGLFTTIGVDALGNPFGNYLEVNNKTGTRSIFGADGNGLYSTDTLNTVLGNWTTGGGITFHVTGGTKEMTLGASGNLGIGRTATTNKLEVEGDASKTTAGNWIANSDARLKKNINPLSSDDILHRMLSLQGVTYEWNDTQTETKRPGGIQYGFTAQNIQEVFPSLVTEDNNGYLQTPYGTYDAMTVEAIRALNNKVEKLEAENTELKTQLAELNDLKNAFAELKTLIQDNKSSSTKSNIEVK